ncbi:PaaI family thioesterase [soil metagenome]
MATLGASLEAVAPGCVRIAAPVRAETGQQHGYAHAGLGWTIGDSAAGYSALGLRLKGWEVLTVEMKINPLSPAAGRRLVAEGRVLRAGRRLIVVASDIHAEAAGGGRSHVATMLGTMFALPPEAARPEKSA